MLGLFRNFNKSKALYVRPVGTTYGAGDGSNYDNAWSGFAAIDWAQVTTKELIVSGVHTEKLTVGASNFTLSFDQSNATRIDGTGIAEVLDIISKTNITINNAEVINATTSNLNINNSLNIVTNDSIFNGSGNQGIQHLGTSTAIHNNATCNNNIDDGFSAHNNCEVVINGGEARNNSEGIAFVNTCKFTVDGTVLTGNTLNDITCRSNQENVFINLSADVVVVDSPDAKVGVTASFDYCDIKDLTVHNGQEVLVRRGVVDYAHTVNNGLGDIMTFNRCLVKRINSKVGAVTELLYSRLLSTVTLDLYGTLKATESLIENTGGVDHALDFQSGSTIDINYCVLISALTNKYAITFRTGATNTSFKGNTIDGKGIGKAIFVQGAPIIHNTIIYDVVATDNAAGATYINCDFFNAGVINGVQTNCIYTDPLFIDAENLDYTLGAGSGAIGSGLTVTPTYGIATANWKNGTTEYPSISTGFNVAPFDIGAYIS